MKILYIGNSASFISSIIWQEFRKVTKERGDDLVVVDTAPGGLLHRGMRQDFLTTAVRFAGLRIQGHRMPWGYYGVVEGQKVENINSFACVNWTWDQHFDAALSVACPQRFGKDLLEACRYPVNYHNGLLPKYRGLYSMSWPFYFGESYTGFTFHRMVEAFDEGNMLLHGALDINGAKDFWEVLRTEVAKTRKAATMLPELLAMMGRKEEGVTQGKGRYFGQKALDAFPVNEKTLQCFGWGKAPERYIPKWLWERIGGKRGQDRED
ncbi:hypothetical protein LCGC14_0968570 [marine sediment metagenome]|uniref:Formyl transferase N-terminal domain-containing protein n=1 Tax=marine sediment metagenome TaxID=412755 RepID=A0A0F9NYF1_9ZZZZ